METATLPFTQTSAPRRVDRQAGPWHKYWLDAGQERAGRTGDEALLIALMRGPVLFISGYYGLKQVEAVHFFVVPANMDYVVTALADALLLCVRFDVEYLLEMERPMMDRFARRCERALPVLHCLPIHNRIYDYLNLADIFLRIGETFSGSLASNRHKVFDLLFRHYPRKHIASLLRPVFAPPPNLKYNPGPVK